MNPFTNSVIALYWIEKLWARFCQTLFISMLLAYWFCSGVLAEEAVKVPADLMRTFSLESGPFPPAAEKVEAALAIYSMFGGDTAVAIEAIDAADAGGNLRAYGDWFFTRKQFKPACFYYQLSRLTRWDSGIDSRDRAYRKYAKYRLELIEENRDDYQGKPLEMYAEASELRGAEFREKLNRIKQLYPESRIVDDVDFALSKAIYNKIELVAHWQQFLCDHPESPLCGEVDNRLTITYDSLGAESCKAGRNKEAEKWYAKFLERPVVSEEYKYFYSYIGAGRFYEQRGKLDVAERAYRKAVDCGGWPLAYNALGFFCERQYDIERFVEFLRERGKSEWEIERYLRELGQEKWHTSFGRFPRAYDLCGSHEVVFDGGVFVAQLYKRKAEKQAYRELPQYVLRLRSNNVKLLLRIDSVLFEASFKCGLWYKVVSSGALVLCVPYPSGGNGLNVNPWYVVSLENETFLKNLGQVGYVEDFDGDGQEDLVWYDDIWEGGLGWFCATGGRELCPKVYYHIRNGKLVGDDAKNIRYWRDEIRKLDEQIETYRGEIHKDASSVMEPQDSWLLHMILSKLLRYRLLGESAKGMEELGKDLRYFDDECFYFQRWAEGGKHKAAGKYPVGKIEETVTRSLECLPVPRTSKRSIWAYVNPP